MKIVVVVLLAGLGLLFLAIAAMIAGGVLSASATAGDAPVSGEGLLGAERSAAAGLLETAPDACVGACVGTTGAAD